MMFQVTEFVFCRLYCNFKFTCNCIIDGAGLVLVTEPDNIDLAYSILLRILYCTSV